MVKSNKVAEDISSAPFRMLAERYRAFDVPIFPCKGDDGKKPLVKWAKFQNELPSGKEMAQWLKRFPNANIALVTGRLSNITVIDSDNPDIKLEELFDMFGETPLAVFTPRGGYHLYYRYNGERNALSYSLENIDIRGEGGFVIVPPSKNPISGRSYEFVEGDISSLQNLPFLKGNLNVEAIVPAQSVTLGKRNKAVFSFLKDKANLCVSKDELLTYAAEFNLTNCSPPLTEKEIKNTLDSVWGYKEKGKLFFKGQQTIPYPIHKISPFMFRNPRAAVLYADLIACHKGIHLRFAIGQKAYAKRSGWDEKTVRELINLLVNESLLKIVYKGGKHPGDASLYEFN